MIKRYGGAFLLFAFALAVWGCIRKPEPTEAPTEASSMQGENPSSKDKPIELPSFTDEEMAAAIEGAMRGNYQDQRNAAYMLSQGSLDERVSACAWRVVIIASGHKQADASDETNLRFNCDNLPEAERENARLRAIRLIQQIGNS